MLVHFHVDAMDSLVLVLDAVVVYLEPMICSLTRWLASLPNDHNENIPSVRFSFI